MTAPADDVRTSSKHGLGRVVLDREEAINALSEGMIVRVREALEAWRRDPDVELVLLTGEGQRGLSAGGDVRALHRLITSGDTASVGRYFREEYAMNALIGEYQKPIISVMHGVTMGGGIGIAAHAGTRIVTETSRLAMPETRIGFTPDVGGSWLLARTPGRLGEYFALTSDIMGAHDAIYCGLADYLVPSANVPDVVHAFETRADPQTPAELVLLFDETPYPSRLAEDRAWIDDAFAAPTVEAIIGRLRAIGGPGPEAAVEALQARAPLALKVTLEAIRRAREQPTLRAALEQEYGLVMWFVETQPDMVEGIRAQLIDKDLSPVWSPKSLAAVPQALVAEAFAHRPEPALW
ncbi:enoyl-CoA hydratase/isomerase family protein [Microbacterium halophytorum]|uniref:enoyl-CoA hydratase/isomerase family protein n=1 Tax=Microbacterium halophytorum TaxID=2067568 RepID=UPI000CFD9B0D|nr:enoyl-CoA hydratase/isomerase family protein [Microbacterium halophytorum]